MGVKKEDQPNRFCRAGFAYHEGKLKFHSWWLNSGVHGCCNADYPSNGDLDLSELEKKLVRFVFEQWKLKGKHSIFEIPESLDRELSIAQGDALVNDLLKAFGMLGFDKGQNK